MASNISLFNDKEQSDGRSVATVTQTSPSTNPHNINQSTIEGCRNYISIYKTVLRCNPNNEAVKNELVVSYLTLTNLRVKQLGTMYSFEERLKDIEDGLKYLPEHLDLICQKAKLYLTSKPALSLELFQAIQKKKHNYVGIHFYIGSAHFKMGDYSQALIEFKQQYSLSQYQIALLKIGECYFKLHNYAESLKHLLEHRKLIKFNVDREYLIAQIYTLFRRYNSALQVQESVLKELSGNQSSSVRKADTLFAANRGPEACKVLDQLVPQTEDGLESKGLLYSFLEKRSGLDDVIALLSKRNPKNHFLPVFRAILKYLKNKKEVIPLLNELRKIQLNNNNPFIYLFSKTYELRLLFSLEKYKEGALLITSELKKHAPGNVWADKVVFDCLMKVKPSKTQDAIDYLEVALKNVKLTDKECTVDITDQILELYVGLAECYITQKNYKVAQTILVSFPEKKSENIRNLHHLALAKCYLFTGEMQKALDLLTPLDPFSPDYVVVRIQCHFQLKEYELSRKSYSEGLRKFPGNQEIISQKSTIDNLPKAAPKEVATPPRRRRDRIVNDEKEPVFAPPSQHLQEEARKLDELRKKKDAEIQAVLDATERKRRGDSYRPTFKDKPLSLDAQEDCDLTGLEILQEELLTVKSENLILRPTQLRSYVDELKVELVSEKVKIVVIESYFNFNVLGMDIPIYDTPSPTAYEPQSLRFESIVSSEDLVVQPQKSSHNSIQQSKVNRSKADDPIKLDLLIALEKLRYTEYTNAYEKELLYRGVLLNLAKFLSKSENQTTSIYEKLLTSSFEYNVEHLDDMIARETITSHILDTPLPKEFEMIDKELSFLSWIATSSESLDCLDSKEFNLIQDLVRGSADIIVWNAAKLDKLRSNFIFSASHFLHINTYKTISKLPGLLKKICLSAHGCKEDLVKIVARFS